MFYFTSDHHFGHTNVIKYCNRPFKDVEEMDETMINRWNYKVKTGDIVFYLGDFTLLKLERARYYFSRLNGSIHIINNANHHDYNWMKSFTDISTKSGTIVQYLDHVYYMKTDKKDIVLSHFPFEEWNKSHYGSIHLHGHSHGNLRIKSNRYDVGVDCWDFYPVTLDEILEVKK